MAKAKNFFKEGERRLYEIPGVLKAEMIGLKKRVKVIWERLTDEAILPDNDCYTFIDGNQTTHITGLAKPPKGYSTSYYDSTKCVWHFGNDVGVANVSYDAWKRFANILAKVEDMYSNRSQTEDEATAVHLPTCFSQCEEDNENCQKCMINKACLEESNQVAVGAVSSKATAMQRVQEIQDYIDGEYDCELREAVKGMAEYHRERAMFHLTEAKRLESLIAREESEKKIIGHVIEALASGEQQ